VKDIGTLDFINLHNLFVEWGISTIACAFYKLLLYKKCPEGSLKQTLSIKERVTLKNI
jgi:hypothetical protein